MQVIISGKGMIDLDVKGSYRMRKLVKMSGRWVLPRLSSRTPKQYVDKSDGEFR
jgi:hypothetical protein